jgi:enoyl-CoA hydratase/carnithine racemase
MSAHDDFPVRVDQHGTLEVWTIDREPRANALSRPTLFALGKLARAAETNPSVRGVIVRGAGYKVFCAGADLKERAGMSDDDVRTQIRLYRSELGAVDRLSKPVVALLNGHAFGGGLEMALMCDLRIAVAHAELALPETTLGIIPAAGGTQKLPRIVGEGRAKEMILLGRRISAETAYAWGLVQVIVTPGVDPLAFALEYLAPIATGAPMALTAALEAVDRSFDEPLRTGLDVEALAYDRLIPSRDRREALEAFAGKRKPVFEGR